MVTKLCLELIKNKNPQNSSQAISLPIDTWALIVPTGALDSVIGTSEWSDSLNLPRGGLTATPNDDYGLTVHSCCGNTGPCGQQALLLLWFRCGLFPLKVMLR